MFWLGSFLSCGVVIVLVRWICVVAVLFSWSLAAAEGPIELSGIYPHLAMFNDEGECGTGAVVPFADRLWVVTYAPHMPQGSSDKLYEITPQRRQIVRPESIGGTPANRMLHRESNQLFIGPYAIDSKGTVRVIPYKRMFGRPTGTARHLTDPGHKIYHATMEEGLYEVDVKTLEVTELWADEQKKEGRHANLPGYHGKGLFAAQGRIVYANNGEHGALALKKPDVPSGVLAEWDGRAAEWSIVRRNQFTEVTGPGGITGESQPGDPIWSIGWDHRSLILMSREGDRWQAFRLPKASHSYDGAHGWNTEWPRIRDIGEDSWLMTMHGMFWKFPRTFSSKHSAGIAPRSTYLKVIGDFCRWNEQVVLGCDDTAKNEFLNKRKAKGEIAAPQSQSNLWFIEPRQLDELGPVIGRGAVWLQDNIEGSTPSDPFLISGFERRSLNLTHHTPSEATITLEYDERGTGQWQKWSEVILPARGTVWLNLSDAPQAVWVRLTSDRDLKQATAWFSMSNVDRRTDRADSIFDGIASLDEGRLTGGIVRARGQNKRTLHFSAIEPTENAPRDVGLYELDEQLTLKRVADPAAHDFQKTNAAIPVGIIQEDAASLIFVDEQNQKWRLPRGSEPASRAEASSTRDRLSLPSRVCREVATERDLFNAGGTFFELPAENAGGFSKVRAVATHNRRISDFCSYRGLFIVSGVANDAPMTNRHIIKSDDGQAALWAGAIDDVWRFGKPRGVGGPWHHTSVKAGVPSDPYLLTGYDQKMLVLSTDSPTPIALRVECDLSGTGLWVPYREFEVMSGKSLTHEFPASFTAYWLRVVAPRDCIATAQLTYK